MSKSSGVAALLHELRSTPLFIETEKYAETAQFVQKILPVILVATRTLTLTEHPLQSRCTPHLCTERKLDTLQGKSSLGTTSGGSSGAAPCGQTCSAAGDCTPEDAGAAMRPGEPKSKGRGCYMLDALSLARTLLDGTLPSLDHADEPMQNLTAHALPNKCNRTSSHLRLSSPRKLHSFVAK